ncbi:MAG: response regulator transcription factor [Chloroflexota bacterium]|nr:response regulator transcription factor [Chloroflexota bacterium]
MPEKSVVLVVDDEPQMVGVVSYALQVAGFDVLAAYNGEQALRWIEDRHIDLVILDVMMPGLDGFEVCRRIRCDPGIPVLMLTARSDQTDVIAGLELGADDYMPKPFSTHELVLRAQAILRRTGRSQTEISSGPLHIDLLKHTITLDGRPVDLTPLEYRLLACLAKNAGRVLSTQELIRKVWKLENWQGGREMVKVMIHRLRQKVEPDQETAHFIQTVRGVGYRFDQEDV